MMTSSDIRDDVIIEKCKKSEKWRSFMSYNFWLETAFWILFFWIDNWISFRRDVLRCLWKWSPWALQRAKIDKYFFTFWRAILRLWCHFQNIFYQWIFIIMISIWWKFEVHIVFQSKDIYVSILAPFAPKYMRNLTPVLRKWP